MRFYIATIATCIASLAVTSASLVTLPFGGKLQGVAQNVAYDAYFGVPFAAPPTGSNRWQPPQPPANWTGTRNATTWGNTCLQFDPNAQFSNNFPLYEFLGDLIAPDYTKSAPSEDCLYLNVYVPRGGATSKAVAMFIHGGGLIFGGAAQPVLDGRYLAATARNAIIVTVNHRLGVFGYSGSSELAANSTDGSTANYGWLDQIAALRWIKNNIAAFGGDTGRTTLWAQSAGAQSALWHLIYTNGREQAAGRPKLFQQVVMESPNPPLKPFALSTAQLRFDNLATAFNCTGTGIVKVDCLRALSGSTLNDYQRDLWTGLFRANGAGPYAMAVDGVAIPENAWARFLNGQYDQDVKIIIGNDANEGTGFIREDEPFPTLDTFIQSRAGYINATYRAQIVNDVYPSSNYTLREQKTQWFGDMLFTCADRYLARLWAATNPKVWYYRFSLATNFAKDTILLGSPHASELVSFFRHIPALERLDEYIASYRMSQALINFVVRGNPNIFVQPRLPLPLGFVPPYQLASISWPAYNGAGGAMIDFGNTTIVRTDANSKCDYFDGLYNAILP
ncbi:Alpha/Beta hydrolase protein [Phlyctochytrium arcticum]|nr:Alpha/Beta hydrolase protein [Phlyctochytrium arcticum]